MNKWHCVNIKGTPVRAPEGGALMVLAHTKNEAKNKFKRRQQTPPKVD